MKVPQENFDSVAGAEAPKERSTGAQRLLEIGLQEVPLLRSRFEPEIAIRAHQEQPPVVCAVSVRERYGPGESFHMTSGVRSPIAGPSSSLGAGVGAATCL